MIDRTANRARDWDADVRYLYRDLWYPYRDLWPGDRVFYSISHKSWGSVVYQNHYYWTVKP